jgi:hypothetical protein
MARTKQEIVTTMQQQWVANPILQQLYGITGNSPFPDEFSLVSLEAQLIEVFATAAKTIEDLLDMHLQEVDRRIAEMKPGTLLWYQRMALAFQRNYNLQWNNDRLVYEYPVIDEQSQIVKLAAVMETAGSLIIKVAQLNNNNAPEQLLPLDLTAFEVYMEQIKYAGVNIEYISREPDLLLLKLRVFYNPLILAPNGSLLSNSNVFPVNNSVKEYLKLIPFNGLFNVTDLIDALQKTTGVVNPLFIAASAKYGLGQYTTIADYYRPNAGYLVIAPDPNSLEVEYVLL